MRPPYATDRWSEDPSGRLGTQAYPSTDTSSGHLAIRCPSCRLQMRVAVDTSLAELTCDSCGGQFSLVNQSQATHRATPLSQLGRFELIERLGVGGFGTVWKARDNELDRTVAIKIPRKGLVTEGEKDRFFHEARAAAQLHHPNIVDVHECGVEGDSVYIVSDYIRGVTLGDLLTGRELTAHESAELCVKIADALHHAHQAGVIHRDLKPANIMLDGNFEPHLMDFGLARRDIEEVTVTRDGQLLGTPAYMSPEQAQGEAHQADCRSDIYSLGVIMFQLLTGELPFRGNPRMLVHQVIHDEPPSPRKLNGTIPRDLETITLKCLEKEPPRRYPTAQAVRDELSRWQRREPIEARPLGPITRSWRWAKRKPMAALVVTMLLGLAMGGPLVAVRQAQLLGERNAALAAETVARADAIEQRLKVERALSQEKAAHRRAEEVTDFALAMFETPSRLDAGRDSHDLSVARLFQQAGERVRKRFPEQPAIAWRLLFALAKSLRDLGEDQVSANLAQAAIDFSRSANGPDAEETLMAEELLASCLHSQGHRVQALRMLEDVARRAESVLGERHPAYLVLCTNISVIYAENQQLQAIGWIENAAPLYATVLPEEHPDRRFIANRAGWVYCMLGRYEQGLKYFEEALDLRRKYDGRLAHATLRVQHANVAWALTCLGRHDEAIANQKEAVALFRERYPENSERWLWPLAYLVYRYYSADRYDEAIGVATEYLDICDQNIHNPDHYYVWTIWGLHDALYRQGRHDEAKVLARRIQDSLRQAVGEHDPSVYRSTLRHLRTAAHYGEVDAQVEQVVNTFLEVFKSQRRLQGDDDPDVALAAEVLAIGLSMASPNAEHPWNELVDWLHRGKARTNGARHILFRAAIAAAARGDSTEYHCICEHMLTQYGDVDSVFVAEQVTIACVALPNFTADAESLVRLSRVTGQSRLVGAALYRAGKYDEALAKFEEAASAGRQFNAWDLAFRAMALRMLGRDSEAKQALLDAQQRAANFTSWHEEVQVAILIQEATALRTKSQRDVQANE